MIHDTHKKQIHRGFTLIEVLLTICIVGIVATASRPMYVNLVTRNAQSTARSVIIQALRRAQSLSMDGYQDSAWGAKLLVNSIILFQGTSYVQRAQASDEVSSLPTGISFSGFSEVVFAKNSGVPATTGAIYISAQGLETISVTVNSAGTVTY